MVRLGEIYIFPCKDYCHSENQFSFLKFECMKILVFFLQILLITLLLILFFTLYILLGGFQV